MTRYFRSGIFALMGLGVFYLWRNRSQVQQFLESKGINTPLDTSGTLTDTIRSGIAKVSGSVKHQSEELINSRRAI